MDRAADTSVQSYPKIRLCAGCYFVTAMDTNPLAADPLVIIRQEQASFDDGLQVLSCLTEGKVHVCHGTDDFAKVTDNNRVSYTQFTGRIRQALPVRTSTSWNRSAQRKPSGL